MSHDSGIRLFYSSNLPVYKIVDCYLDWGWSLDYQGEISLLPLGDNYNWTSLKTTEIEKVFNTFRKKSDAHETIGISLIWKGTDIGVNAHFYSDNSILFSIAINRKVLENTEFTDVSWYLPKILMPLTKRNIVVEFIEWRENI